MNGLSRPTLIALIVTVAMTGWTAFNGDAGDSAPDSSVVEPVTRSTAPAADGASVAQALPDAATTRRPAASATPASAATGPLVKLDLFTLKDWTPPPPPPKPAPPAPPPPPPPPPQAPPLESQFQVIGRLSDGDNLIVYLSFQGGNVVVGTGPRREDQLAPGDIIGGQYRIDSISSTALNLTYLPFNQAQTLRLGD